MGADPLLVRPPAAGIEQAVGLGHGSAWVFAPPVHSLPKLTVGGREKPRDRFRHRFPFAHREEPRVPERALGGRHPLPDGLGRYP